MSTKRQKAAADGKESDQEKIVDAQEQTVRTTAAVEEKLQLVNREEVGEYSHIIAGLPEGKRVALVMHKIPDADAIASALGIKHDLARRGIAADLFGAGGTSNPQNRTMVTCMAIDIKEERFFRANKDSYGLVVFCDCGKVKASFDIRPDIVIDHHVENDIPGDCLIINKKVGACSTIVYFLLKALSVELTPDLATALAIGINADTKKLTKKDETTDFDRQVHKELRATCNYPLFEHINSEYEIPRTFLIAMGVVKEDDYDGYVVVRGIENTTPGQKDVCAFTADLLFRDPGARLVVVIAMEGGECIRASIRTDLEIIQIDDFCKKVFEDGTATDTGKWASAGARPGSGGAEVPLSIREQEEWAAADKEQKGVLFKVKLARYRARIKKALDS